MKLPTRRTALICLAVLAGGGAVGLWALSQPNIGLSGAKFAIISLCALGSLAILRNWILRLTGRATTAPYVSLLMPLAMDKVAALAPAPDRIRAEIRPQIETHSLSDRRATAFQIDTDQTALILRQIMTRWGCETASDLTDAQLRELWLVNRLVTASPADAAAYSVYFAAPDAMLALRDALARPVSV